MHRVTPLGALFSTLPNVHRTQITPRHHLRWCSAWHPFTFASFPVALAVLSIHCFRYNLCCAAVFPAAGTGQGPAEDAQAAGRGSNFRCGEQAVRGRRVRFESAGVGGEDAAGSRPQTLHTRHRYRNRVVETRQRGWVVSPPGESAHARFLSLSAVYWLATNCSIYIYTSG